MRYEYIPKGVCSRKFVFEIEDNIIKNLEVSGGCQGNLSGISKILRGMNINDVIKAFEGTTCGPKKTSCPDQIAVALKEFAAND